MGSQTNSGKEFALNYRKSDYWEPIIPIEKNQKVRPTGGKELCHLEIWHSCMYTTHTYTHTHTHIHTHTLTHSHTHTHSLTLTHTHNTYTSYIILLRYKRAESTSHRSLGKRNGGCI